MRTYKSARCVFLFAKPTRLPSRMFHLALWPLFFLLSLPTAAWSAGGGSEPSCLQHGERRGWPGTIVRGVIAVQVSNYFDFFADLDATLRLQRSGREDAFRIHVPDVFIDSPEHILCAILDAHPLNATGQTVHEVFTLSSSKIPRIDARSIRRESVSVIPGTGGILSTLADITIHYVEPEQ